MADPEKTEAQEPEAPPEAKSKSPKLLIIVLLAVVLAGGGFFGLKIMKAGKDGKSERLKVGKIITLQEFLVNLADQQTYVRTDIALGVAEGAEIHAPGGGGNEEGDDPRVRDSIILILSAKKPGELATLEGKAKLKKEIIAAVNKLLGHGEPDEGSETADNHTDSPEKKSKSGEDKEEAKRGPVLEVYFTSFATQKY